MQSDGTYHRTPNRVVLVNTGRAEQCFEALRCEIGAARQQTVTKSSSVEKSRMRRRGTRDMWQRKKASELPHPFEDRRALEIRSDHPRIVNGIGE